MVLRVTNRPQIEDPRKHSAETVDKLRQLLASGAPATPDPRRADFFEIENCTRVFYIHISPVSGKVLLLGTWQKDAQPRSLVTTTQAA